MGSNSLEFCGIINFAISNFFAYEGRLYICRHETPCRVVSLCPSVCGTFWSVRSMSCLFVCRVRVFLCPWLSSSLSFFCVSLPVSASFVIFLFVCVGLFVPVSSAVVPPFVCRLLCVRVVCRRPLFVRGLSFPPFLRSFPFLLSSPPVSVSPVFVSRSVRALPLSVSLVSFRRPRRRGACPSCETGRLFRLRPPKSRIRLRDDGPLPSLADPRRRFFRAPPNRPSGEQKAIFS